MSTDAAYIADVAAKVREAGLPDSLNRWLTMTPEGLRASRDRLNRAGKQPERIPVMSSKVGPKEQATRALRERGTDAPAKERAHEKTQTDATTTPAPASNDPAEPTKEKPVRTPTKKTTTTAKKAAATRTSVKGKTKPATTKSAAGEKKVPRPGSKLELVAKLLSRPQGCTTAEALAETEWPAISFNQQAKALGIKLRKVKDGTITRYYAA